MRDLLTFGLGILELDVQPICVSRRQIDIGSRGDRLSLSGRGSSDDVELALKLSKYLIAKYIKGNGRFSLQ